MLKKPKDKPSRAPNDHYQKLPSIRKTTLVFPQCSANVFICLWTDRVVGPGQIGRQNLRTILNTVPCVAPYPHHHWAAGVCCCRWRTMRKLNIGVTTRKSAVVNTWAPPSNRSTDINIVNLVLVIKTKTRDLNMAGFVYVGQVGVSEISVLCELEYSTAAI